MKAQFFQIFDIQARDLSPAFQAKNKEVAKRHFQATMAQPAVNPAEYELYAVANIEYGDEPESIKIKKCHAEYICNGRDVIPEEHS